MDINIYTPTKFDFFIDINVYIFSLQDTTESFIFSHLLYQKIEYDFNQLYNNSNEQNLKQIQNLLLENMAKYRDTHQLTSPRLCLALAMFTLHMVCTCLFF